MRFYGSLAVILALAILGAESNKMLLSFHFLASNLILRHLPRLEPVQEGA